MSADSSGNGHRLNTIRPSIPMGHFGGSMSVDSSGNGWRRLAHWRIAAGGGRIAAGGGLSAGGLFAAGLIAGGLFASGLNAAPVWEWT